ncbi:MAG: DUF1844 domain-containing protein [Candidatus Bathyarchaeia archaeon]|nr:DUF1844 domain-containing protein [Candidatus Bathyarchaeota archaeon]
MREGKEERPLIDLSALDIDQLLSILIGILAAKAWQYMGLRLIPGKEEIEKDMRKAALAIDCAAFMAERLAPRLPESEARRLKAMITDLQINYARNA